MATKLHLLNLGERSFTEVWELQKKLQHGVIQGSESETLIICRHPPVITLGKGAKSENVLVSEEVLQEKGIELQRIERGGDVTYHGPGQVILYPIINLNFKKRDVGWYMRQLEEVVIRTITPYGIHGERIPGKTGVWLTCGSVPKKIASLGVRLSRWVSMHGVALNVAPEKEAFSLINPCGFKDIEMTSVFEEARAGSAPSMERVERDLVENFLSVFEYGNRSGGLNHECKSQ